MKNIDTALVRRVAALAGERPCAEAVAWLGRRRSLQRAWRDCPRGYWLLWMAARSGVDHHLIIHAAVDCADAVAHFVPAGEGRPAAALELARRWVDGERVAAVDLRRAAVAAGAYADSAVAHAAHAAYAASYAAYAAASYAAYTAGDYADDYADDANAARRTAAMAGADTAAIVRARIPWAAIDGGA